MNGSRVNGIPPAHRDGAGAPGWCIQGNVKMVVLSVAQAERRLFPAVRSWDRDDGQDGTPRALQWTRKGAMSLAFPSTPSGPE